MNKPLIKIFKRRPDTVPEIADESSPKPEVFGDSAKSARIAARAMVKTITVWIDEMHEQNRLAEIIARRELPANQ